MAGKSDRWRPTSNPVLRKVISWAVLLLTFMSILQRSSQAMTQMTGQVSLTLVSPSFGAPGTTVSIRGVGFSSDPRLGTQPQSPWVRELASEPPPGMVEFNGVAAEILFWSDNLITVKVPKAATTGPLRVVLPKVGLALTGGLFEVLYSRSVPSSESQASAAPRASPPLQAQPRLEAPEATARALLVPMESAPAWLTYSPGGWLSLSERAFWREQTVPALFPFGSWGLSAPLVEKLLLLELLQRRGILKPWPLWFFLFR
jgi:hypothetical protein